MMANRHIENRKNHDISKHLRCLSKILLIIIIIIMALPTLIGIKCAVIDNKMANINGIHCVNSHASKTAKIIKGDITQHHVDI